MRMVAHGGGEARLRFVVIRVNQSDQSKTDRIWFTEQKGRVKPELRGVNADQDEGGAI
jgi:hypothetical protein